MKQRLQNLAIAFVSTMISLVILEIALQIVAPPPRVGIATLNAPAAEIYGWALFTNDETSVKNPDTGQPIAYTTNSRGWKDVEHQLEKPEGVVRIVFVGDSNTFAITPLEDGFTRQVELLLYERGYTQVEVISIGVGAWGTDQVLEALRNEGVLYDADFIIHQFSDNDIVNNIWPMEGLRSDSIYWQKLFRYEIDYPDLNLQRIELTPPAEPWNIVFKRNLLKIAIFYYADLLMQEFTTQPEVAVEIDLSTPYDPTDPYYRYTSEELTPQAQYAWALTEAMFLQMRGASEESGAQFLIYSPNGDEGIRQWSLDWGRIASRLYRE